MSTETLNLEKGQKVDLTKTNPGLKEVNVGLGWDIKEGSGDTFDLDAFALLLKDGKLADNGHIIYFGHKKDHGLEHMGDNLTGAGDGDDETIKIHLGSIPTDVSEVLIGVNIYKAEEKHHQNFGQVKSAFIRLYNAEGSAEILKYDLNEDYSTNTGVVVGKLYRKDAEWKFQAIGEGKNGSIDKIAADYR